MKNRKGFTLVEILIVLVILVTVTTGATMGIKEKWTKKFKRTLYNDRNGSRYILKYKWWK